MKIDIKSFNKNKSFFVICLIALVGIVLFSYLFGSEGASLEKVDLTNDETDIHSLVINEVMTNNKGVTSDETGHAYDYVELYNGNDKEINLKNYGLSDEEAEVKWTFGNISIEAKSYLVIYLSGLSNDGNANFKLKSGGGEVLTLFKPNGKVVDAVETVALDSNNCMARDSKGSWVIQTKPTPGFANNINGYEEFLASLVSSEDKTIVINEVLANNKGNFKNKNGEYSGYIEIKNVSDKKIDIANYSLSDDESVSFKWQLPSITLSPDEVKVIFTSGTSNKEGELSTSFKLNSKNGSVVLTNNTGKVIDKVRYENLANGVAYLREGEKFLESNAISPGFNNDVNGIKSFQKEYLKLESDLVISEIMNSNYKYLAQNGGNYYDWIELYNNSKDTINLKDYCLTTNTNTMCTYNLPDVKLESGKYYIVIASGETNLSNNKYKHANFKLSDTESLYITKGSKIIDSLLIANVPKGYSMGKGSSYGIYYYSNPTPGAKNSSGSEAVSYVPSASVKGGTYNDTKSLTVALNGSGKIYYTTDGSIPTTSSKVYSSPLNIKKTTVLRIMSKESGKLKSPVETYSYIVNENHSLNVISLAIDPKDLSNLHSHAWTEGYIKPVTANYIDHEGTGFTIDAGLKLFGGSTRGHAKKSYELKFKKQFGDAKLHYKVFDNVDSSVYDSIVIRSGSQDEMGGNSKKALIRDIVGTSLVREYTTVDVQDYKPVVMYLNGKYWGLYFLREKVDETFVANHYNVPADKKKTDVLRIDSQVKSGSTAAYNKLYSFISNNPLSNKNNYNKVKEMVDIENFADFWIAETWTANNDIVNVRYFRNPNIDNGRWKFIFYDLDCAWYNVNKNYYQFSTSPSGMTSSRYSTFLLRNMMKSSEFKKTYLERLSYNLTHTWDKNVVVKKIDDVIAEIGKDEIKRNLDRWNMSYSTWEYSVNWLKQYAKERNSYMVSQAKSFFNLSSSEAKKYFGDVK